jgi:hypothetical protein
MTEKVNHNYDKLRINECCKWFINDSQPISAPEGILQYAENQNCPKCGSRFIITFVSEYDEKSEYWEIWPEDFEIILNKKLLEHPESETIEPNS